MQNGKYLIDLDHLNKIMIIQNKVKVRKKKGESLTNYLDSVLTSYSSVKIEPANGLKKMTFEFKSSAYNKCIVIYNPLSYMIESFTLDYRKPLEFKKNEKHNVVSIIRYKNFTEKLDLKKDFFSEKNYFLKERNKVKPSLKFQTYQVVSKI